MSLIKRTSPTAPGFSRLFDDFFNSDLFEWSSRNFSGNDATLPAVNVKENEDSFVVEVAAPGMRKEDFKVELVHNRLSISSERREEQNSHESDRYSRREFSYASFTRSFTLPELVEAEKIEARYSDGILSLHIPKKEEAKPKPARLIEIS